MAEKSEWEKKALTLLKVELTRRNLSYDDLRQALEQIGIKKTTSNITKTINLGKFSFAFFLQCAEAIGLNSLALNLNKSDIA
ncbi:MAG: hypothetical protein HKM04_05565 [Legionellales bacterium]|nr:hypothetical protein [Legionellales bacterium]